MKNKHIKIARFLGIGLLVFGLFVAVLYKMQGNEQVLAASTIVVNSVADTQADDGECTLREAIVAANSDTASGPSGGECIAGSGTDTINFAITGAGVHTIQPLSLYPNITETVHINGYSQNQTGSIAVANTAIAPAAMNGTIQIEIDGSIIDHFLEFSGASSGSVGSSVRGLSINRFGGTAIIIGAHDVTIAGNYIGTAPNGTTDRGNGFAGITNVDPSSASDGAQIGGLNPEDRNIISGNDSAAAYPRDNWVFQGNYIGVDKTGMTKLANSVFNTGSGGLSIDDCSGVVVGGSQTGAVNVIAGNNNQGLAPDNTTNLTIQGNYIGVGADGTTSIPNDAMGIDLKQSDDVLIGGSGAGEGNIISNNGLQGIYIDNNNTNVTIQGNNVSNNDNLGILISDSSLVTVGGSAVGEANSVDNNSGDGFYITNGSSDITVQGNSVSSNTSNGVAVDNSTFVTIGGTAAGSDNVISDNTNNGVDISGGSSDVTVAGNTIDTNNNGVNVASGTEITIGGSSSGSENTIVSNLADGVSMYTGSDIVSVLSNSIFDNGDLGIDLNSDGVTANDTGDIDPGVNDLLNSPEANNITESSGNTNVVYTMDVPVGDYRIEFFSNSVADPSGYGEGEVYLGYTNITKSSAGSQQFSHVLTGVTGVTNISLTTSKRNVATTSGFGATSEFGKYTLRNDVEIVKEIINPRDVALGATISYSISVKNNGPSDLDLDTLDGSGGFGVNPLFLDIYPTDLTYIDSPTTEASCTDLGPGSALGFGPVLANHSDHGLIECAYAGPGNILTAGQSFEVQLNFQVSQTSSLEFSNYAMNFSAPNDPNESQIGPLFAGELIDGFKASDINNFSEAAYPVPVTPPGPSTNAPASTSPLALLGTTGDIVASWYGLVGLSVSLAGAVYIKKVQRRKKVYRL